MRKTHHVDVKPNDIPRRVKYAHRHLGHVSAAEGSFSLDGSIPSHGEQGATSFRFYPSYGEKTKVRRRRPLLL